ncbi:MAG TPA: hypothetical protein VNQ31_07075, partial [Sphingomonadaceae bacterium]|nr:hypothetical protein [Sphingomonadaceae bacterium]
WIVSALAGPAVLLAGVPAHAEGGDAEAYQQALFAAVANESVSLDMLYALTMGAISPGFPAARTPDRRAGKRVCGRYPDRPLAIPLLTRAARRSVSLR